MKVTLISVGTELLIGQTIDTNAAWIAKALNNIGSIIHEKIVVGDNANDMIEVFDFASKNADIIFITGGLGPTSDDITKTTLASYFNDSQFVTDEASLKRIRIFSEKRKLPMLDVHHEQAKVPSSCTPIPNELGTAPGMWFKQKQKQWISMPGVPSEMKHMMLYHVLPLLKQQQTHQVVHKTILTYGMSESEIAKRLLPFEKELSSPITLSYLPSRKFVRLRLSSYFLKEDNEALDRIETLFSKLSTLVEDIALCYNDLSLESLLAQRMMSSNGKTLSTAESCTGGYLAHLITSQAGSSAYYKGSIIAYDNMIKITQLQVSEDMLQKYGAVSAPIVEQMAIQVRNNMNTDYAIALSGVMGPDGGTPQKPVGTFFVAIASEGKVQSFQHHLSYDRPNNIQTAAQIAIVHLLKMNHERS